MLEQIVKNADDRQAVEKGGWKPVLDDLHQRLSSRGHSAMVMKFYEQAAVHFALWTTKRRIHASEVTDKQIPFLCNTAFESMSLQDRRRSETEPCARRPLGT